MKVGFIPSQFEHFGNMRVLKIKLTREFIVLFSKHIACDNYPHNLYILFPLGYLYFRFERNSTQTGASGLGWSTRLFIIIDPRHPTFSVDRDRHVLFNYYYVRGSAVEEKEGKEMDKKRFVGDVVLLGIGLSLFALGIYMKVVMSGNIIYGPLTSMQILMWAVIVGGLILTLIGGIRLYKGRFR